MATLSQKTTKMAQNNTFLYNVVLDTKMVFTLWRTCKWFYLAQTCQNDHKGFWWDQKLACHQFTKTYNLTKCYQAWQRCAHALAYEK